MDTTIIVAIIAGTAAIVSPITALLVTHLVETSDWTLLDKDRRAVLGSWEGSIIQEIDGKTMKIKTRMHLTSKGRKVNGDCLLFPSESDEVIALDFIGGFRYKDFIKFDYKNKDKQIMQFGSAILSLNPKGKLLIGSFVGFGSMTERIITGTVEFKHLV